MTFHNSILFLLTGASLYLCFLCLPTARLIFERTCVLFVGMWVTYWLYGCVKKTFFNKKVPVENKAVFITGCDSGFGNELAKRLDLLGYRVFAGCYDSKGDGASKLAYTCSSRLTIVPIDVTSDESVVNAKQFVKEHLKENILWGVINNAGVPQAGEMDWTTMEEIKRVCEVNTFGTVRVTKAFLTFLKASRGRVVNLTSSVGRFYMPSFVAYCMSKSAAVAFSEGIRMELDKWGIQVISIEPFFYKTALTSKETAIQLITKTWNAADAETREEYGEEYLQSFIANSDYLKYVTSSKIHQVVDCLEDAVTAEEPQYSYFPSYLPHKFILIFLKLIPYHVQKVLLSLFYNRNSNKLRAHR